MVAVVRIVEWTTDFEDEGLWNKMNRMLTQSLQWQLDLEADHKVIERWIKENFENGKEYARLTKTPYWNLMLDRWVLRIEERLVWHKSFLP